MSNKCQQEQAKHKQALEFMYEVESWVMMGSHNPDLMRKAKEIRRYLESHPVPSDFFDDVK